jgi:antitoxin HicB
MKYQYTWKLRRKKMNKDLAYYMSLPYKIVLTPDYEGEGWLAEIPELPGCMTSGDSQEEVLALIEEAKELWLEHNLAEGRPIPEPHMIPHLK